MYFSVQVIRNECFNSVYFSSVNWSKISRYIGYIDNTQVYEVQNIVNYALYQQ